MTVQQIPPKNCKAESKARSSGESVDGPHPSAHKEIMFVAWAGLWCNVFLAVIKITAGWFASSQAVLADGVHSLSDLVTDVAIIVGARFWTAPADDKHPYGHRRIETLITAGIGLVLAGVGFEIGYNAVVNLKNPSQTPPGWLAFAAAIVSIVLKEILYRWTVAVGRRVDSPAIVANGWHHRSDALSSAPAAIAVAVAALYPGWSFVDLIGALIVCLFILQAAWKIAAPAFAELADSGAPGEKVRIIEEIALGVDGVCEVHDVRTRYHGGGLHVDMHVLVAPQLTVLEGHDIAELAKQHVLDKGPKVLDVVVHLEPFIDSERKQ